MTKSLLVLGKWKYVAPGTHMIEAENGGPMYPNASTAGPHGDPIDGHSHQCGTAGCLFDLEADVLEEHECSAEHPEVVAMLQKEMAKQARTIYTADHKNDPACSAAAKDIHGGYYGPWKELGHSEL